LRDAGGAAARFLMRAASHARPPGQRFILQRDSMCRRKWFKWFKWFTAVCAAVLALAQLCAVPDSRSAAPAGTAAPAVPPGRAACRLAGFKKIPVKRLDEGTRRQYLRAGTATVRLTLEKGERTDWRQRASERLLWVAKGRVVVRAPGLACIVRQGEVLIMPPNASHEVAALENAVVVDFLGQGKPG